MKHYDTKILTPTPTEEQDQIALIQWMQHAGIKCNASANGGSRHPLEAKKLKRMGVSPGFPDLEFPIARGIYPIAYIELKRSNVKHLKNGSLTIMQIAWILFLRSQGYYADVAYGFDDAKMKIEQYLSLTHGQHMEMSCLSLASS